MTLEHPEMLALFALAIPIVILHFVRRRPKVREVSALSFWEDLPGAGRTASLATRMLRLLPLLINLLILSFVTLAAASPAPEEATPLLVVVDNSPSMEAREADGRTRLKLAKRGAEKIVAAAGRRRPMALATCDGAILGFTEEPDRLREAIRGIDIDHADISPARALEAIARSGESCDIVVISDHNISFPSSGRMSHVTIGSTAHNVAIVDLALVDPPARGIRARIRGSAERDVDCRVVVTLNGQTVLDEPYHFARGVESEQRFDFARRAEVWDEGGALGVRLAGFEDSLAIDNEAFLVLPRRRPPRVVVVARRRPGEFLADLLALLGNEGAIDHGASMAVKADRYAEIEEQLAPEDIRIFYGCAPEDASRGGRFLIFSPEAGGLPASSADTVRDIQDLVWNRAAEVNGMVSPDALRIKRARRPAKGEGMEWLMAAGGLPIAACGWVGAARVVDVGFDVEESDFALHPSFPVFVRNAIEWLRREHVAIHPVYCLGQTLVPRTRIAAAGGRVEIARLGGGREEVPIVDGMFRYRFPTPGIYGVAWGGRREICAVNFANREESNVAAGSPAGPRWEQDRIEDVRWDNLAAAGALILLMIEWLLYYYRLI